MCIHAWQSRFLNFVFGFFGMVTAIFRSLLYEACGRMVNPIYGSAGLLRSGNWKLCQNTVEAVLAGAPVTPKASEAAATHDGPPLKAYDIRHVNKNLPCKITGELHRVKTRKRFKRSGAKYKGNRVRVGSCIEETNGSRSHGSSLSHQSEAGESRDIDQGLERELEAEPERRELGQAVDGEIELELSLGLAPFTRAQKKPKGLKRSEAFELGVQWYKHM